MTRGDVRLGTHEIQRSELRRRNADGQLFEVVIQTAGEVRTIRPGDPEWADYLATEDRDMVHQVKAKVDGSDGVRPFNPGDVITVDTEFARRLVARDHGELLDAEGQPMALVAACRALRMTDPGHAALAAGQRSPDSQAALVAAIAAAAAPPAEQA
jgi:hypothetical protein